MSPSLTSQRKNTLSSIGERSSTSSDAQTTPRIAVASTFSSSHPDKERHFSNGSVGSHRSSTRPENPSPALSSNIPFFPRRTSAASHASHASRTPNPNPLRDSVMSQYVGPSPYATEFHFPRPSDPTEIDALFDKLQIRLGTSSSAADGANRSLDRNKKWLLVESAAHEQWKKARQQLARGSGDPRVAGANGGTRGSRAEHAASPRAGANAAADRMSVRSNGGKNESPEWYIARFMDGTISQQQVASLSVCLRTYELQ